MPSRYTQRSHEHTMKSPHCLDANLVTTGRGGGDIERATGGRGPKGLGAPHDASAGNTLSNMGRTPRGHPRIPRRRVSILDELFNFFSVPQRKPQ